ncbi:hypothetical protein D9M68_431800 [compost metagenome]
MSSRYSITLLPMARPRLSFSSSCRAALLGALAGSMAVTPWPSAGQLMRTKIRPRRSATYSMSVVLP